MAIRTPPPIPADWAALLRLIPGYDPIATAGTAIFDIDAAQRVIEFFAECLHFIEDPWAGQPFLLQPWQQAIVANLFGWIRPDGTRRYREAFIEVPKKNGKSPMLAGIVLYVLFCDNEQGAQLYSAAADREQASLIYRHARGMMVLEPEMLSRAKIYASYRSIVREDTNSVYKALSAEVETKHGFNSHLIVVDELHAMPNSNLVDTLQTGTASRRQPLTICITTSDWNRPSICNEKEDYACQVRDGVFQDASFLPVVYKASPTADWTDPKVWAEANPNLGISVSLDYMERECRRALQTPRYQNTFKRLHLNMKTQQDILWIDLHDWDVCCHADIRAEDLKGQPCFGGLDLASTSDLCAFLLYFPDSHIVLPTFWLPEETAEIRFQRARVPYPQWVEQGFIRTTEGNRTDYDVIRRDIGLFGDEYPIKEIAIDRWNSTQLQNQLIGDGFDVTPFGQGYSSMSAPAKEFERLILGKELQHDGHPVLRWNVANCMIEQDSAGNIKPSKKKSSEKIDGCVAAIMAIGRAIAQEVPKESVYEKRGILVL